MRLVQTKGRKELNVHIANCLNTLGENEEARNITRVGRKKSDEKIIEMKISCKISELLRKFIRVLDESTWNRLQTSDRDYSECIERPAC